MALSYSLWARASSDYCRRHDILKSKMSSRIMKEGWRKKEERSTGVRNMVFSQGERQGPLPVKVSERKEHGPLLSYGERNRASSL